MGGTVSYVTEALQRRVFLLLLEGSDVKSVGKGGESGGKRSIYRPVSLEQNMESGVRYDKDIIGRHEFAGTNSNARTG